MLGNSRFHTQWWGLSALACCMDEEFQARDGHFRLIKQWALNLWDKVQYFLYDGLSPCLTSIPASCDWSVRMNCRKISKLNLNTSPNFRILWLVGDLVKRAMIRRRKMSLNLINKFVRVVNWELYKISSEIVFSISLLWFAVRPPIRTLLLL